MRSQKKRKDSLPMAPGKSGHGGRGGARPRLGAAGGRPRAGVAVIWGRTRAIRGGCGQLVALQRPARGSVIAVGGRARVRDEEDNDQKKHNEPFFYIISGVVGYFWWSTPLAAPPIW